MHELGNLHHNLNGNLNLVPFQQHEGTSHAPSNNGKNEYIMHEEMKKGTVSRKFLIAYANKLGFKKK